MGLEADLLDGRVLTLFDVSRQTDGGSEGFPIGVGSSVYDRSFPVEALTALVLSS